MPPRHPTYDDTRRRLASGETSVLRTVREYLQAAGRGARLNAFVTLLQERALERASVVDRSLADGTAGPLAGMVAAVKDVLCVKGERTTCGSRMLENFVAPYDATAVRRLEEAGAVVIGKTNMDEFAMGSSNENSAFGPVLNPLDETRVPGGSSGGSCVSVAAGMAHAALGTDTGGSIRQPAAFCGIVGLKPTYGRVSRYGLVALSSSFDQIGPFANSVADAARVLGAIAGKDACDSTSADVPVPDYLGGLRGGVRGLKVGVPPEALGDGLQREVRERFAECIDSLRALGAEILEVPLPTARYHIAAYYILMTAEASSNLARYDGARYGRRSAAASDLASMYELSRGEGFGAEVKRRIMLGTYVLSAGYYDAYYRKAQKVRRLIREDFLAAFRTVDCMLTPTTPTTAFRFGEKTEDPLQMYLSDVFTVSANLAGIPAISVPFGADDGGMPVGVQLMGRPFDEATLLRAAETLYPSPAPDGEGSVEAPARTRR